MLFLIYEFALELLIFSEKKLRQDIEFHTLKCQNGENPSPKLSTKHGR